jgi:hypothetical protein
MVAFLLCGLAFAQQSIEFPSTNEINDLLRKADEKVSAHEKVIKNAKPYLERIGSKVSSNDLDAAADAHTLIKGMLTGGASAYGLVALVATLDDLSLNAARGTTDLLRLEIKEPSEELGGLLLLLSSSATECNDISELLLHSTLRFISAEETILAKLTASRQDSAQPAPH